MIAFFLLGSINLGKGKVRKLWEVSSIFSRDVDTFFHGNLSPGNVCYRPVAAEISHFW